MIRIHRAHVCVCTLAVILPNFRFIYENAWKTCLGAELSLVGTTLRLAGEVKRKIYKPVLPRLILHCQYTQVVPSCGNLRASTNGSFQPFFS